MGSGDGWGWGTGITPRSSVSEDGGGRSQSQGQFQELAQGNTFLPFLSSSFPRFSARGIQCATEGERGWGGHNLLSSNQCCPVGPRCSNRPYPVSALYVPPSSPRPPGMARRGQRGSHPQGQLGGWQRLLREEQEGGMRVCPGKRRRQLLGRPSPPTVTLPLLQR